MKDGERGVVKQKREHVEMEQKSERRMENDRVAR